MPFSYKLARNTNTFKLLELDNNLCTQRYTTLDIFRCTVIMLSIVDLEIPTSLLNLEGSHSGPQLRVVGPPPDPFKEPHHRTPAK